MLGLGASQKHPQTLLPWCLSLLSAGMGDAAAWPQLLWPPQGCGPWLGERKGQRAAVTVQQALIHLRAQGGAGPHAAEHTGITPQEICREAGVQLPACKHTQLLPRGPALGHPQRPPHPQQDTHR